MTPDAIKAVHGISKRVCPLICPTANTPTAIDASPLLLRGMQKRHLRKRGRPQQRRHIRRKSYHTDSVRPIA